jgi:hypothetical protein
MWQNYTNAVLGLVLIVVAFTSLAAASLVWTVGIIGAVIFALGLWGGSADSAVMHKRHENMQA